MRCSAFNGNCTRTEARRSLHCSRRTPHVRKEPLLSPPVSICLPLFLLLFPQLKQLTALVPFRPGDEPLWSKASKAGNTGESSKSLKTAEYRYISRETDGERYCCKTHGPKNGGMEEILCPSYERTTARACGSMRIRENVALSRMHAVVVEGTKVATSKQNAETNNKPHSLSNMSTTSGGGSPQPPANRSKCRCALISCADRD